MGVINTAPICPHPNLIVNHLLLMDDRKEDSPDKYPGGWLNDKARGLSPAGFVRYPLLSRAAIAGSYGAGQMGNSGKVPSSGGSTKSSPHPATAALPPVGQPVPASFTTPPVHAS